MADQVVAAGAGLRVQFGRIRAAGRWPTPWTPRCTTPRLRTGAARVKASFDEAGGAPAAAAAVEELLCRGNVVKHLRPRGRRWVWALSTAALVANALRYRQRLEALPVIAAPPDAGDGRRRPRPLSPGGRAGA